MRSDVRTSNETLDAEVPYVHNSFEGESRLKVNQVLDEEEVRHGESKHERSDKMGRVCCDLECDTSQYSRRLKLIRDTPILMIQTL